MCDAKLVALGCPSSSQSPWGGGAIFGSRVCALLSHIAFVLLLFVVVLLLFVAVLLLFVVVIRAPVSCPCACWRGGAAQEPHTSKRALYYTQKETC